MDENGKPLDGGTKPLQMVDNEGWLPLRCSVASGEECRVDQSCKGSPLLPEDIRCNRRADRHHAQRYR